MLELADTSLILINPSPSNVRGKKKANCFLELTLNCLSFGLFWPWWFNFCYFLHNDLQSTLQDNASFETKTVNVWRIVEFELGTYSFKVQVNHFRKNLFSYYFVKKFERKFYMSVKFSFSEMASKICAIFFIVLTFY